MRKVYSHENLTIVSNAKRLLELNNIDCLIKNEFHASGGHVGFEAIPIELWVQDDAKATEAISILENELAPDDPQSSWICSHCGEKNDGSFEICWKCQKGH